MSCSAMMVKPELISMICSLSGSYLARDLLLPVDEEMKGQADEEGAGAKSTSDARLCLKSSRLPILGALAYIGLSGRKCCLQNKWTVPDLHDVPKFSCPKCAC